MNERERRFVEEYVLSGGGTQAAVKAGYSPVNANRQAYKLLRRAEVSAAIKTRLAEISGEKLAETQEVMEFLTRVLRGQESTQVVIPSGKIIRIPVPIGERISAANMLLKIYGAYRQEVKVEVSATEKYIAALEAADELIAENAQNDLGEG